MRNSVADTRDAELVETIRELLDGGSNVPFDLPPVAAATRAILEACGTQDIAGVVVLGGPHSGSAWAEQAASSRLSEGGAPIRVVGHESTAALRFGALLPWMGDEDPEALGAGAAAELLLGAWLRERKAVVVSVFSPRNLDPASQRVLAHLALSRSIKLVVLAEDSEALPLEWRSLCRTGLVATHEMESMTLRQIAEEMTERFGVPPSPSAAQELWWLSAGKPVWLLAVLRAHVLSGRLGVLDGCLVLTGHGSRADRELRFLVDRRLGRLGVAAMDALLLALSNTPRPGEEDVPPHVVAELSVRGYLPARGAQGAPVDASVLTRHLALAALAHAAAPAWRGTSGSAGFMTPAGWTAPADPSCLGGDAEPTPSRREAALVVREVKRLTGVSPDDATRLTPRLAARVRAVMNDALLAGEIPGLTRFLEELGDPRSYPAQISAPLSVVGSALEAIAGRRAEAAVTIRAAAAQERVWGCAPLRLESRRLFASLRRGMPSEAGSPSGRDGADRGVALAERRGGYPGDDDGTGVAWGDGGCVGGGAGVDARAGLRTRSRADAVTCFVDLVSAAQGRHPRGAALLRGMHRLARLRGDELLRGAVEAAQLLRGDLPPAFRSLPAWERLPGEPGVALRRLVAGLEARSEEETYAAALELRAQGLTLGADGLGAAALAGLPSALGRRLAAARTGGGGSNVPSFPGAQHLTPRELVVVSEVVAGLSNAAIAQTHGISVRTVEGHLYQVYSKLALPHRRALIALVQGSGRDAGQPEADGRRRPAGPEQGNGANERSPLGAVPGTAPARAFGARRGDVQRVGA